MTSNPAEKQPFARVTSIRTVVRDGWYNAWTDLIWWKEYFWLSHFRGLSHGILRNTTGLIADNTFAVILRSADLRRWHEAQVFEAPGGIVDGSGVDVAHLCASDDRLYAFFRKVSHGADGGMDHCSYVSSTADDVLWSKPEALSVGGEFRPYTWRIGWYEGRFYCGLNYLAEGTPIDLIVSEDDVHWSNHAEIAAPGHDCSEESALHWRPDGELWCVIRTATVAAMYSSRPPYTDWDQVQRLPAGCDAPAMCESGGRVYLAGRCASSAQGVPAPDGTMPFALQNTFTHPESAGASLGTTGLYRLTHDRADLLVMMPPAYDASYPGLVSVESGKLIMSYYSDVAYVSGQVPLEHFSEFRFKESECDIYLAEIEVGER